MESLDGQIIKATTKELYSIYMKEEYFKVMSFCQFLNNIIKQGALITDWEDFSSSSFTDK